MRVRSVFTLFILAAGLLAPATSGSPAPGAQEAWKPAVARVWHGRTPKAKGDEYASYLAGAIAKVPDHPRQPRLSDDARDSG
jgi:hypothetical protein